MAPERRICIFLTGALGDFITSLPALNLLRQSFRNSEILLVGNPLWLPLAKSGARVDEVRSMEDLPLHAGFTDDLANDHVLSRFLAGFDLVVSWFGDREGRWERTLRRMCSGRLIVQPYHRVHAFEGHVSDFYLASLKELGLSIGDAVLPAFQSEEDVPTGTDPFLCLHPGSGSEKKNWPKEGFLEVAVEAFRRWRLPSTVLLGPAEEGQRAFWSQARCPLLTVQAELPILEVARTLRRATLYVGNDSGITHMAAATGAPVVALFGPTDPARWAPRGGRVEVLGKQSTTEQVLGALERLQEDSSIIL
jgi:ADP-heptose:LPS heptosyltransferase